MDVSEYQTFIEGSFPLVYKKMSLDNIVDKLTKFFKPNKILESVDIPYPLQIFHPMVQFAITIINQVLGLKSDQSIDELTLGFLFTICVPNELVQVPKFNLLNTWKKLFIFNY